MKGTLPKFLEFLYLASDALRQLWSTLRELREISAAWDGVGDDEYSHGVQKFTDHARMRL